MEGKYFLISIRDLCLRSKGYVYVWKVVWEGKCDGWAAILKQTWYVVSFVEWWDCTIKSAFHWRYKVAIFFCFLFFFLQCSTDFTTLEETEGKIIAPHCPMVLPFRYDSRSSSTVACLPGWFLLFNCFPTWMVFTTYSIRVEVTFASFRLFLNELQVVFKFCANFLIVFLNVYYILLTLDFYIFVFLKLYRNSL